MDIRTKTCVIIRKNSKYLVGKSKMTGQYMWSIYRNDAWRTRNRETAREVARKTGGIEMLYNPVANQIRIL